MSQADELLRTFLTEVKENLEQIENGLIALEGEPSDPTHVHAVFRAVHTIKGGCGFYGFTHLESLAHEGETLLGRLREKPGRVPPQAIASLLAMVDAIKGIVAVIEASGAEPQNGHGGTLAALTQAVLAQSAPDSTSDLAESSPADVSLKSPSLPPRQEPQALPEQDAAPRPAAPQAGGAASTASVRLDVRLVDAIMDLVGELVLARNHLQQVLRQDQGHADPTALARLSRITADLQASVAKARMQPIMAAWKGLPRLVRDVAHACGKSVALTFEGEETELDRSLLEAIKDPLTHLVRNAIDHGLECPDERRARGKPAQGRVHLRAAHEGGHVVVEVGDDGRGIDHEKVRARAVAHGLVSAEQAASMGREELCALIFLPGFSTSPQVTAISGRGVGMDVVKTNIERIGGDVMVDCQRGVGTSIRLRIPLTLSIIPALTVEVGGWRMGVPQADIRELIRLGPEGEGHAVEIADGKAVCRLRGSLLTLVDLAAILKGPAGDARGEAAHPAKAVVVETKGKRFGLMVDRVEDTLDVVVKPLGRQIQGIGLFAGAAILGDGAVALILDAAGIAARATWDSVNGGAQAPAADDGAQDDDDALYLLVTGAGGARMALPLDVVTRIERVSRGDVEAWGNGEAVQYRGAIMPLVGLSRLIPDRRHSRRAPPRRERADALSVVVMGGEEPLGLVVEEIIDVAAGPRCLQPSSRAGVKGTAVIQGRITEFLDMVCVKAAFPRAEESRGRTPNAG